MRKGISEVVGMILLLVMVIVSAGSFFYWYSSGQDTAQTQTETYQSDVFNQIYSQTSALVKAAYSSNREVNINNFAEYVTQICADEKSINLAAEEIRLEVYEGYGAGTELICGVKDFSGECNSNATTIFGVLGGKSTVNGMYTVSSTDGSTWTTSSISSDYNSYKNFNFTHLGSFTEKGNSTRNPDNLLLMGVGAHKDTGNRKSVLAVLDRTLKGNSYNITDLDENVTVYHSAELVREVVGSHYTLFRGGALTDPLTEQPKEAFITKQNTAYSVPERLVSFGTNGRPIVSAKTTAIQEIVRLSQTQLLVGVTGALSEGGIGFIDETQDLVAGMELNYATAPVCPYDVTTFAQCGITVGPGDCDPTFSGISAMLKVPEFTNSSKTNSNPIFVAVNNLTNGSVKTPSVFWTGEIQDETSLYCINLDSISAPINDYDITEMKYHQNSNQVLLFLKSHIPTPEFIIVGIRDDGGTYTANLVSSPLVTPMDPLTFDAVGDYVYAGGTNRTHATIVRFGINASSGGIANETRVYSDNTYSEVQKLNSYTVCTERQPACITGCNQILKKGDCTLLNVSIEDSSCDLSKYSSGTKFTIKTGIGKYFEKLEIFTKKTGTSTEVNASEVS